MLVHTEDEVQPHTKVRERLAAQITRQSSGLACYRHAEELRQRRKTLRRPKETGTVHRHSASHEVAGQRVCRSLQGEGRLVDHDVSLCGCGPQSLSGWRTCDPTTLAATLRQQAQLEKKTDTHRHWHKRCTAGFDAGFVGCYPVAHIRLCLRCQDQRPPLFRPLGCVHSKGIVAVPEHWNQRRHFIYKHMKVLKQRHGQRVSNMQTVALWP